MTDDQQTWRLVCPVCEWRGFHDETDDHGQTVKCRTCGSTAPLEDRKALSRETEPNPDNNQPTLQQFAVGDDQESDQP